MTHLQILWATLDTTEALVCRSRALLPRQIPDRASAVVLDREMVGDVDEARSRMSARVIEILSAAGMTCELRYLGATLQ